MSLVPGDPASLSACASAVAGAARRVAADADALGPAGSALGEGWPGRRSVETRRRAAELAAASTTTADVLAHVTRLLQDQATDLAALVAQARTLEERAAAAGLEVRDGRVAPVLGRLSPADADADRARQETAVALQGELDLVLAQHRRRRDFVGAQLRDATARLAGTSADLRRA